MNVVYPQNYCIAQSDGGKFDEFEARDQIFPTILFSLCISY